ncbi:MAG: membrane protein insertase YidC [Candidatus Vogelbacteria bacterium]|nr:membrane protein insertase YidC [Candidatus Vogelbacteria bacterium]
MISNLWRQIFFNPLYNLLIAISAFLPGQNLGGAIIVLTIIVKLALLPFQHQTLKMQKKLKLLEPQLQTLKKNYQQDRNEQAKQIMALYQTHGVNPLTSFWTILIQIPIVLALFFVFRDSATLHPDLLYSFVPRPETISADWLGLIDLTKAFLPLSLLVGLSQFIQLWLAAPGTVSSPTSPASQIQKQMRYWLPIFIVFASASLPAAISLYWLTSNLFAIVHELLIRRQAAAVLTHQPR